MAKQSITHMPVTNSVRQPPTSNFSTTVTDRMARHMIEPHRNRTNRRRHNGLVWRTSYQCRHMPIIDSENVTNTLMAYMTKSADVLPPVDHSATKAEKPINNTPLCAARRSERLANQW